MPSIASIASQDVDDFLASDGFSNLDLQFARLMERLHGAEAPALRLASALVSRSTREGHICLDLRRMAGALSGYAGEAGEFPGDAPHAESAMTSDGEAPPLALTGAGAPSDGGRATWEAYLEASAFRRAMAGSPVVGEPGDFKPLILDAAGRLYLNRYFEYQRKLAELLRARIEEPVLGHAPEALRERLERLFPAARPDAGSTLEIRSYQVAPEIPPAPLWKRGENQREPEGTQASPTGSGLGTTGPGMTGSGCGQAGPGPRPSDSGLGMAGSAYGQTGSGTGQTGSGLGMAGSASRPETATEPCQRGGDTSDLKSLPSFEKGGQGGFPDVRHDHERGPGPDPGPEPDWQKVAAFAALRKRLCVISGGPGTGKTTTVARILALLIESEGIPGRRIALAAPTGKAAARLQEAIQGEKAKLACPDAVKEAIPETASTIHRLLGSIPNSPFFRHDARHPIEADVVVIDEASMTDLALMSKCVQAVPAKARLIIMGDRHQLASVEAGAVLSDICGGDRAPVFSAAFAAEAEAACGFPMEASPSAEGRGDCIVALRRNFRFGSASGIGRLSEAIRGGDADEAMAILRGGGFADLEWRDIPDGRALQRSLPTVAAEGYAPYLVAESTEATFDAFGDFRILCAVREGPFGVSAMNAATERTLADRGFIRLTSRWYRGRPVMVTRNDYGVRLFNGDIGIVTGASAGDDGGDREDRADQVLFSSDQGFRAVHAMRLPEHETVYALTVHKSQGSEFGTVLLVLPDRDSPVLTRELLYTGVTRARSRLLVWGREEAVRAAVSRPTARASGLYDALWGMEAQGGG